MTTTEPEPEHNEDFQTRQGVSGLLPGDMWPTDIPANMPGLLEDYTATPPSHEQVLETRLLEHLHAQTRRLFPGMTGRDREYMIYGALIHQVWLSALLIEAENEGVKTIPIKDLDDIMDYRTMVIATGLVTMEDDITDLPPLITTSIRDQLRGADE